MRSMEKLDHRDPIAEFVAEELTSAAVLDAEREAKIAEAARRMLWIRFQLEMAELRTPEGASPLEIFKNALCKVHLYGR